jgi:hypothetical protein
MRDCKPLNKKKGFITNYKLQIHNMLIIHASNT